MRALPMAESLRDKLRRLRREDGASTEPPKARWDVAGPTEPGSSSPEEIAERAPGSPTQDGPPSVHTLAASLARRGERLEKHHERRAEARALRGRASTRAEAAVESTSTEAAARLAALSAGLVVPTSKGAPNALERCARSGVLARTTQLAREHAHGAWRLEEALAADAKTLALLAKDDALGEHALRDALFLDTETTGLSGGAGTYVFLVGLGSFTESGFEVWQGFLLDPSEERALLVETAERIARAPLLVTFFGKSFDRHRLEDKMRLHGITPPFAEKPHLDLYHPLRRLYGKALPDTRLKTMERALCGVQRPNDLPGSFAPAAWFDFLAERPHRLEGVFAHNHDDVLSLVTLAAHAGRVLEPADGRACELEHEPALRARGLARLFAERREHAAALDALRQATSTACVALGRTRELAASGLFVRLGRLAEARAGLVPWLEGELDLATVLAHVELLRAERRARLPVPLEELERLTSWTDRHTVGRDHARLCSTLRSLRRRPS